MEDSSQQQSIFDKIGGRKATMAFIIIVAGVLVEVFSKNGLGTNMVALLSTIYGTFSISNTLITNAAAKLTGAETTEEASTPSPSEVNLEPVNQAIQANSAQLASILNQIGGELVKQQEVNQAIMQGLNSLQTSQSSVQKGMAALLGRGAQ
jgi:hypothetical protein